MKKISKLFINILKNEIAIALLCVLPFLFIEKNIHTELCFEAFVVLFATFVTAKKFSKKECCNFACFYFTLFIIIDIFIGLCKIKYPFNLLKIEDVLGATCLFILFSSINPQIILPIVIKVVAWLFGGGIIFYLVNLITVKIVTNQRISKFIEPLRNFFSNPLKTFLIISIISTSIFAYNGLNIKPLTKLENSGFIIETVLNNEKLLLFSPKTNRLATYDVKNDILDTNCCKLDPIPNGYKDSLRNISISKMPNGDIFIRRFIEKDKKIKLISYIYSLAKNEVIYMEELPNEIAPALTSFVFLDNEKIFCIDANKNKKTYIYNIKDKTLTKIAETKQIRRDCKSILLNNGKILIWGGDFNDKSTAELYDIDKNEFTEIPIGFRMPTDNRYDELHLLENGNIIIKTKKIKEVVKTLGSLPINQIEPNILLYNPKDNSFTDIILDKDDKYKFIGYNIAVTKEGKIIIAGGELASKKTKKFVNSNNKIYIFDTKTNKIKPPYTHKFPSTNFVTIYAINNNEVIAEYVTGTTNKHYYKIKF